MKVNTVLGTVDPEEMGVTLSHEHLFIDITNQFREPADPQKRRLSRAKVSAEHAGVLSRNPYALRDNLLLDDLVLAAEEVGFFREAGGRTIVDCTSRGIGRDPERLRELSRATGVNVIAGCGYYTADTHPPGLGDRSAEDIADELEHELCEGIDGTGIRAGVIGEIGTGKAIHPDERKCLVASAKASRRTGAAIQVHIYPWGRTGLEAVDVLLASGADPRKVVICHTDVDIHPDYQRALLERGVYLQFDNFGKEFAIPPEDRAYAGGGFAADRERARAIASLVERGFERLLLVTNDLCLKGMLRRYGGRGYAHAIVGVAALLREEGIPEATIHGFSVGNPRTLMA
jgi:phosphotriesterase-related protein